MKRTSIILAGFLMLVLFGICVCYAGDKDVNVGLPTKTLRVGSRTLVAEIADTDEQRRVGLMNRTSLAEDAGMLFIFPKPQRVSFWMKNTLIPLSAAFIAKDGIIVKIAHMKPHDESSNAPDVPVLYVLEVSEGWFRKAGVRVGDRIEIDPR